MVGLSTVFFCVRVRGLSTVVVAARKATFEAAACQVGAPVDGRAIEWQAVPAYWLA